MRCLRIVSIFSFALMMFAGCSKEDIQPDSLIAADGISLKGAKVEKGPDANTCADHFVPFKAKFELAGYFQSFGPVYRIDMVDEWLFPDFPPTATGGMHIIIRGGGNATHLGKTEFSIEQWWTRAHPNTPILEQGFMSYGQGATTFIAANGDQLHATYFGWADHSDDTDGVEILTEGTFTGGTGRFEGATGSFTWDGLFFKTSSPMPSDPPPVDTEFGYGEVIVTGKIKY